MKRLYGQCESEKKQCEYVEGHGLRCHRKSEYALYQLEQPFNEKLGPKVWVQVCNMHDRQVVIDNTRLERQYPNCTWRDVEDIL